MDHAMDAHAQVRPLAARFDAAGWGLLFIMFGALALPRGMTEFALVAGAGAAMIGLNALRVAYGVPVSWFDVKLAWMSLGYQ